METCDSEVRIKFWFGLLATDDECYQGQQIGTATTFYDILRLCCHSLYPSMPILEDRDPVGEVTS